MSEVAQEKPRILVALERCAARLGMTIDELLVADRAHLRKPPTPEEEERIEQLRQYMNPTYELVRVRKPEDWGRYHFIRRSELFDPRGRASLYNPINADEYRPNHYPLLLKFGGAGVATARLDVRYDRSAVVRLVAVVEEAQRKGHGREMMERVEKLARSKGARTLNVNADIGALGFYEKLGYVSHPWDPTQHAVIQGYAKQMRKRLG